VNKIDGVDSYYKFIVPADSTEDKYIHRNYEGRDRNEYLTFHIPLSLLLFVCVCLWCGDSCWLHENHSSLHLYCKIIDREQGGEVYWQHYRRLNKKKSHKFEESWIQILNKGNFECLAKESGDNRTVK